MRHTAIALLLVLWAASISGASPRAAVSPAPRPLLKSIYSGVHDLSQFVTQDTRGIVLVFLGAECPVARQYLPRLAELHEAHHAQGLVFLGIYASADESIFSLAVFAQDADLPFPVLLDVKQQLAGQLGVAVTPEVVVLNAKFERVYQGAIDDQYQRGGRRPVATEHYLRDALRAVVADQTPQRSAVPAAGCPLETRSPQRSSRAVTYHKDVAPLVQRHCQQCHRADGPGPFELTDFADVASNAEKIREVVADRRMPPWHGLLNPEFGRLHNDKRLPDEELATILNWIDAGAPEGDPADAPRPIRWPDPTDWAIGKPDFVYRMPEAFVVPKTGTLEYQFFRVRLNLEQDRWFRGVEIKPGNPAVVHHVALHIAPTTTLRSEGLAVMAQLYGINGESARLINDFVPGDTYNAKVYPADQAVRIPKGTDLIFEVHYTPDGRAAQTDRSMVAFQWAEGSPQHEVHTSVFRKPVGRFRIPPHDPHFRVEDTYYFPQDVEIDAIRPHFHLRGKSYRLELIERDESTDMITRRRTILSVPIFDPAWQRTYELETPLRLPAGTELLATGHYDNSSLNPNNPDPTAEVLWGQQTTDEMFSTRFKYRLAAE
jgi:peroxiredoxin/mono/diheme cytochrome c family protein